MGKKNKINGADYLLLLLYLKNQAPIISSIKITKMMFLFTKEICPFLKTEPSEESLPSFFAYNYGPFSTDVYNQIALFSNIGFITVTYKESADIVNETDDWEESEYIYEIYNNTNPFKQNVDGQSAIYTITKQGSSFVESNIYPIVSKADINLLEQFKQRIMDIPNKDLLRYVYNKYPDMTSRSLIKDKVIKNAK